MENKKEYHTEENRKNARCISLADEILAYIHTNQMKTGDKIPSERKLTELFGASRASVREAIRILQDKGFLEVRIGNGTYLKDLIPAASYKFELWKIDYMELLDIKTTLEYHLIEELCEYLSPADILAIEETLRQLEAGYREGIFDQAADNQFHRRIRNCSHNLTLIQLLDNLIRKLDDYGRQMEEMRKGWYNTIPLHRDLFQAIIAHDAAAAKNAYYGIYELDKKSLRGEFD